MYQDANPGSTHLLTDDLAITPPRPIATTVSFLMFANDIHY